MKNTKKDFEKMEASNKRKEREKIKRSGIIKEFLKKTLLKTQGSTSEGKKYKYFSPWDVAEQLHPALQEMYSYKASPERNSLGEFLLSYHMLSYREFYRNWAINLRNYLINQKNKEGDFGDLDETVKLILDNEEKTVLTLTSHSSCEPVNTWILIHEKKDNKDAIHVRELHKKSDYPKKDYPEKLNLKFYRDRNYEMSFVEKWRMTPLGGVYGDIRDNGYIISYDFTKIGDLDFGKDKDVTKVHHFYEKWQQLTFLMRMILRDIDDEKERK